MIFGKLRQKSAHTTDDGNVGAFSCQGDIWNLAKQNEHITDHLNGGSVFVLLLIGGEYRDRTGDLLHAMQALSQLS